MPPLLKGHLEGQHLMIPNVVVPLSRVQSAGEKGTGMQMVIRGCALGKTVHQELSGGIWQNRDRSRREHFFQASKRLNSFMGPAELLNRGKLVKGCGHRAVDLNKVAVEVDKAEEPLELF